MGSRSRGLARAAAVTWLAVLAVVLTVPALLRYTAVHTSANVNAHPSTVHMLANTSVNSNQGFLSISTLHDSTAVSRISGSPERLPPVSFKSSFQTCNKVKLCTEQDHSFCCLLCDLISQVVCNYANGPIVCGVCIGVSQRSSDGPTSPSKKSGVLPPSPDRPASACWLYRVVHTNWRDMLTLETSGNFSQGQPGARRKKASHRSGRWMVKWKGCAPHWRGSVLTLTWTGESML